ncbi:MAG: hypothetical protein JOY70_05680, partial [Acidisphaera sp.]|nr:hypothetical protein [Acidisphaera sp.]
MSLETKELARSLAENADERVIVQVVNLVESMRERGAADELLVRLRPRLVQLRPPRNIKLPRLLFTPLDGVIVPGSRWRPGMNAVPRSALLPLAS